MSGERARRGIEKRVPEIEEEKTEAGRKMSERGSARPGIRGEPRLKSMRVRGVEGAVGEPKS